MSLLFPAFLVGLLGLALPWFLHRFRDQKAPEHAFPSGRFLEATTPPVSRTRQLKYRGLLTLRVLTLLFLCFLFAQPWLKNSNADAVVSKHHVIALDQSLSMRTADRWPEAILRARDIVAALPAGDSVELLGFDKGIRRIGRPEDPVNMQLQALSTMEPGYQASDYGLLMQGVNRIAHDVDVPVKLWLITDVQQSALPSRLNALYANQVSELSVESVLQGLQRNVYVQASAFSTDGVNVQVNVQLLASESSVESGDASEQAVRKSSTVRLYSGDRLLLEQEVSLQPFEPQTLVFDSVVMPPASNPVFVVALAESDDLPDDDRVEVVVKMANPMPVVLLATGRHAAVNATAFLATALETDELAQAEVRTGSADQLPAEVQHIVSARLLSDDVDLDILQFLDKGANALLFSGAVTRLPQSTGQLAVPRITGSEMGVSDNAHPLQLGQLDWSGTRFYDVPPLALSTGDRVLLQTTEQQPVLVERPSAKGRLLILNDRLDGVSSNLPLQPAFVSLMQSILGYFDASTALPEKIVAGDRFMLPARVQVLDPDDRPLLTLDASAHSGSIELDEPGLYKIIGVRGEHVLQVILDAHEANIGTVSDAALLAWQSRYDATDDAGQLAQTRGDEVAIRASEPEKTMTVLESAYLLGWRVLLPILVVGFVLESTLGNRRLDVRRDGS